MDYWMELVPLSKQITAKIPSRFSNLGTAEKYIRCR